jgi:hypothetical protein
MISLESCPLVQVEYVVKVKIRTEGIIGTVSGTIPVIIGTIPVRFGMIASECADDASQSPSPPVYQSVEDEGKFSAVFDV